MENRRITWFLVIIGAGLIVGLFLGWSVFPRKAANLPISELRMDYKVDYVLMVATVYEKDQDLDAALLRLEVLDTNMKRLVKEIEENIEVLPTRDFQRISMLLQAVKVLESSALLEVAI